MDRSAFEALVGEAMLAPSAHNTQPARWALRGDVVEICADMSRRLPIGDPDDRDLQIACGAAVEGTVLAFAARGVGAQVTMGDGVDPPIARILPKSTPPADDVALSKQVRVRVTHRAGFAPVPDAPWQDWSDPHMTLVTEPDDIAWIAKRIDVASAKIMKDRAFRAELLHWMRLRRGVPGYDADGLNKDALAMDLVTAAIAGPVLGTALYDILSRLGFGPALSGEAGRSRDASCIALFHWPKDGSYIEAGRMFYRSWLTATAGGLVGWPAAALADDPATCASVSARFAIPTDQVLFNAIRLGRAMGRTPVRTRLPIARVII